MKRLLDDRDRRILELLRLDAWLSYADLGRQVHLSASAVQRRVERMIASGIIRGAKAEVELPDEESSLTIFLLAELENESTSALEQFSQSIAADPAVVDAHYVTGEGDVLLKIELPDVAAYDRFLESRINSSALVRRFKTFTVLRSLTEVL